MPPCCAAGHPQPRNIPQLGEEDELQRTAPTPSAEGIINAAE